MIDRKIYERIEASFEAAAADMEASVTRNASLIGSISGLERQIDVLVDARWSNELDRRIIFEAQGRARKIDVKDVETFEGLRRDVIAARGVLICASGHTNAALQLAAQLMDIRLLSVDEALEIDHAAIDPCPDCAFEKRKPGLVFWDRQFPVPNGGSWAHFPLPIGGSWAIVFTGKCDVCRSFAFWCWDCGEKLVVPDDESRVCGCGRRWFTEADQNGVTFIVAIDDGKGPLGRRSLTRVPPVRRSPLAALIAQAAGRIT